MLCAEHLSTLTSMNNLAFIWKGQGRDTEAVKLMEGYVSFFGDHLKRTERWWLYNTVDF